MGKILIGTCGYSYNEWVGPVYPEGTKREQFLPLYAERFDTVEVDYTYYAMPKAKNIAKMAEDASALGFALKASDVFTHRVDPFKWADEAKTYMEAVEPLRAAGRLEAVLFQFPFSFHYDNDNRRYLGNLLAAFSGANLAVEFRNTEWLNTRVIDGLKERKAALVSLDMPELKKLPPKMDVITAPFAYFRLHGRNSESWWGSDSTARYDYLYSDSELEAIAERLKQIIVKTDRLLVYFNNHARGQAVRNAEKLLQITNKK